MKRMEFVSQGGILERLSEEDFLDGVTLPANPDLMDIFNLVILLKNQDMVFQGSFSIW